MSSGIASRSAGRRTLCVALSVLLLQVSVESTAEASEEPARGVCGTTVGVPSAPEGAQVVEPGTDLNERTKSNPPGTTFWLAPGTHHLADDQFGQVLPKDGNVYLGAPGAVLDGRRLNRAAFTTSAKDVVIRGLTIRGFLGQQDQGVVNHDSGERWTIQGNVIEDNDGAAMMTGSGQRVIGNCLRNNGQYGINAYHAGGGLSDLVIEGNEITGNNTGDWETKIPGCGCSGGAKFWAVNRADIVGNFVHHNHGVGLWADTNNNDFLIQDNVIEDNASEGLFYEISYNLDLIGNTFRRNALVQGRTRAAKGDTFPVGAVYLSESGGEPRLPARTSQIDIRGNLFSDNWSGITLWENADRFCNSPANTSTFSCTALVPSTATCSDPGIATAPLYSDCRWKTQRVLVHENTFEFDGSLEGCLDRCGRMAVLSNYGTYPPWSPYRGNVISDAITFRQENRWYDNQYYGPWKFVAQDASRQLTPEQWRAEPYRQDVCSGFGEAVTC